MTHTGLASAAQIYVKLLAINGLDPARLMHEAGAKLAPPDDPNARTSIKVLDAVLIRANALVRDEAWGLKAADCWHPGNLGVLGHAWLASSTLRTGLKRVVRFWRILGERAATRIEESDEGLRFIYDLKADSPVVEIVLPDCVLSILMAMCRDNGGASIQAVRASLRRPHPAEPQPWRDFFGCDVAFGADENSLTLAHADADRALATAHRPLAGVLDSLLTEQLAKLSKDDVVSRCKSAFLEQLASGEPSEEDVAQQLHLSRRTLQRKLAEVDTSYQRLVDDTRREMALRYIGDRSNSVTEITFLLGFSGQSAFSRAFKRWTGSSPTEYRRRSAASQAD
jgi:AraC-like DNA-binding protein